MFKKIKSLFQNQQPIVMEEKKDPPLPPDEPKPKKPRKPRAKKVELTPKEIATKNNQPYIEVINTVIDPDNLSSGYFEFDYNDKFVIELIKMGYRLKENDTDADVVNRWYTDLCRNIVLEMYEQYEANNPERKQNSVQKRDIGDGRSEFS